MSDGADLSRALERIDGRSYRAYGGLRGSYAIGPVVLHVDHVQADPFAAPSRLRLRLDNRDARFPDSLVNHPVRRLATADFLARRGSDAARELDSSRGCGRSGRLFVDAGGQEVLARTAVRLCPDWVELRLEVGLPAAGRRVLAGAAKELLCRIVPEVARRCLFWQALPQAELSEFVACIENQEAMRERLAALGLVAFVADGALLPRESGASDRPLVSAQAVPFTAPESLRVCMPLVHPIAGPAGPVSELSGLGIREGVTLVVGGGYHGKSTLLRALTHCVHPHVPGDGREGVVSRSDLVKIRAEDGRHVAGVGIEAFVRDLPGGRGTARFSSDDASGSTSQAANIVEALEVGARGLLIDEDTTASNFMLRDARMQALVDPEGEPITPFVERVRELYERFGVSSVLVMGGSGDYFDVADCVIRLRDYRAFDATSEARAIAARMPTGRKREAVPISDPIRPRIPLPESFDPSRGRRAVAISAHGLHRIRFGNHEIDLTCIEQLFDPSQTRAVGFAIQRARRFVDGETTLAEVIDRLEASFEQEGLDALDPFARTGNHPGNLARPRRYEIAAAINRLRSLRVTHPANHRGRV